MLDQLKSMAIFAHVADKGSFRAAAKDLSLSPAMVSVHIKKLEQKLGAPLFYRSTRHVTLTREGEELYISARDMLSIARNGLDQFSDSATTHLTELRVAMPDTLSTHPVMNKLTFFAKNHTGIRLNILSSDQQKSVIKEGYDVAIRMGFFDDSELKSKRIGDDQRILIAAPSYFDGRDHPDHPDALSALSFIGFSLVTDRLDLKHKDTSETLSVWGQSVAYASSVRAVHSLCLSGLGLTALPYYAVKKDLDDQRLIRVLPDWDAAQLLPIYIVWPRNADLNLATREFINYMSQK